MFNKFYFIMCILLMNVEDRGVPIANIYKMDPIRYKDTLCIDPDFQGDDKLTVKDNEFIQLIPRQKDREILYIVGASGSGKSYFALQYLKEYKKKYKNNPIYIFSALNEDATLDQMKSIKRIDINNSDFINEEFNIDDFENSLCVFDDIDVISNKYVRYKVYEIMNMISQTGRHSKTSAIVTSHLPCKGNETKIIINEAHNIVFFPRGLGGSSMTYLLEKQLGLSKKQIDKIKKSRSRAVVFVKTFPNVILFNKSAEIVE